MKSFGEKVTALRKGLRMTQEELGTQCEVSKRAVISWEQGTKPRWKKLRKLSKALRCSTGYLYYDEEQDILGGIEKDEIMEEVEGQYGYEMDEKMYQIAINAAVDFAGTSQGKAGTDEAFRLISESLIRCSIKADRRIAEKRAKRKFEEKKKAPK